MKSAAGKNPWSSEGFTLFFLGFATLFLELVLIRYLAGNIWNLGYFPNLVLIAVFIGMGLGFIFHHYISPKVSFFLFHGAFFLLGILIVLVFYQHPMVPGTSAWETQIGGELFFSASWIQSQRPQLFIFFLCFLGIIAVFFLISQRTAKYFRLFKPLTAYTLDIAGSCMGICAFIIVSWLQLPAYLWFMAFTVIFILAMPNARKTFWIPIIPGMIIAFYAGYQDTRLLSFPDFGGTLQATWSPYQKVEYIDGPELPELYRKSIWVNGLEHQSIASGESLSDSVYQLPYKYRREFGDLPPYQDILIIGSGAGNDVAAALSNGAASIDAVEIDPVLAKLGIDNHPARPYQSKLVNLIIDDGRAFMTQTDRKYDLIIFAQTDSLIKASSLSQLRLENYLFTEESIRKAYSLLSDHGDLVFYNFYRQFWLVDKIRDTIHQAIGKWPIVVLFKSTSFAILRVGKQVQGQEPDGYSNYHLDLPKDDWPFLYLKQRGVPPLYLKAMLGMFLFVGLLVVALHIGMRRRKEYAGARMLFLKLAFIFMGIAFLLLETKSIIQFSLLFGTTWYNNSLVFLAVLLLVLAANWTASLLKKKTSLLVSIFILLILSCLATLAYPLGNLLVLESALLRFIIASLMTFSPIFFANLIFSLSFRDLETPEHIFGWNLIGSTIGGILEYTSMAFGYNILAVVVAVCYIVVFVMLILATRSDKRKNKITDNATGLVGS